MVPRIAKRGHSFKGAGQYYLHDKGSSSSERVAWTYVHNLPTENPEAAMKYMAHTAMNAERLKHRSGVAKTGRKSSAGEVYSYSLSWHPHQTPDKEIMMESAFGTLELLGLFDHEAVFVSHNETDHPHVHVICNLVHPDTGKTSSPRFEKLKLSAWAEDLEQNEGQIRCEQRVINNEIRRNTLDEEKKLQLEKRKEQRLQRVHEIQTIYDRHETGHDFRVALEKEGYYLAKGDRRGFVLVDHNGEIHSLSRQLKNQRAKDLKAKLADLTDLPMAKILAEQRKHFDRDAYETEQQKKLVDAAITVEERSKELVNKPSQTRSKQTKKQANREDELENQREMPTGSESDGYLNKLDNLRAWEQRSDRKKAELERNQSEQYRRDNLKLRIIELEQHKAEFSKNQLLKKTKRHKEDLRELEALRKTLKVIEQRIVEQNQFLDKNIEESKPQDPTDEKKKKRRLDNLRDKEMKRDQHHGRNSDRDP